MIYKADCTFAKVQTGRMSNFALEAWLRDDNATQLGADSSVVGLVYIAAHMPDAGENESGDGKRKRADSQIVEVKGASHAVYVSRPQEVAALIEEAATHSH